MRQILAVIFLALIAVIAIIVFSPVDSLDDLVQLCQLYPLQFLVLGINIFGVVVGGLTQKFWVLYPLAVFDLILTTAGLFQLVTL